jgi:imidazoleglycerol-phosphate dehydratase
VDISGRPYLVFDANLSGIPIDTIEDFWQGFVSGSGMSLHLDILRGRSDHHKIEALFKALARALRDACEIDPRSTDIIPSTKGMLA